MTSKLKAQETVLPLFFLLGACFVLYGKTLTFGFVWDDFIEVAGNEVFHQRENLGKFFTVPYWNLLTGGFAPYHRPMIPVMILTVSTFFGKNPFGYHLLNVILYSLTCMVYFLFLKRLGLRRFAVWTASTLFLFHPVHTEAVAWGSSRPVLLSGLCFAACLWISSFLSAQQTSLRRLFTFLALFSCYAVGLLTYHSILTLLPVVFFFDQFRAGPHEKPWKLRFLEYGGYVLLSAAFLIFTFRLFQSMGETDLRPFYSPASANIVYTGNPAELFLAPLNTFSRYSEILLLPLNLTPDAYFQADSLSASALGGFILLLGISLFLIKSRRGVAGFALVWIFVPLLTVGNLVPQGGLFAERYLFIPSMGFALWAALAFDEIILKMQERGRTSAAYGLLALILIFFAFKTFTYSETWRNDFRYWLEASILSPQKARTHDKLGIALEAAGHLPEAAEEYEKTLELDPQNFLMTYKRLAGVLKKLERNEEASAYEKKFQELLKAAQQQNQVLNLNR